MFHNSSKSTVVHSSSRTRHDQTPIKAITYLNGNNANSTPETPLGNDVFWFSIRQMIQFLRSQASFPCTRYKVPIHATPQSLRNILSTKSPSGPQ